MKGSPSNIATAFYGRKSFDWTCKTVHRIMNCAVVENLLESKGSEFSNEN